MFYSWVLCSWQHFTPPFLPEYFGLASSPSRFVPLVGGCVLSMLLFSLLSNDPDKVESNFFCYAATVLSPHRNVLIFTQRMHKPTERVFFYVKRFCPIIRAANNNQEKFTILHVPHIGFLCYSD